MTSIPIADELERRGVELAQQGQYSEARNIFQKVLPMRTVPLHRAQVLRNIMLTYEREGNKDGAIATCEEILNTPGLLDTTDGIYLHGQIMSELARLEGRPFWVRFSSVIVLLTAYFLGAFLGAAFGSRIGVQSIDIHGIVITDLRYGGACLGAFLGNLLFARMSFATGVATGFLFLTILGVVCLVLTAYILLEKDIGKGLLILGILILMPMVRFIL